MNKIKGDIWFLVLLLGLYLILSLLTLSSTEVLPFMKIGNLAYLSPSKGSIFYVLLAIAIYYLTGSRLNASKILARYVMVIVAYFTVNVLLDYMYPIEFEAFAFRGFPAINFKYLPAVTLSYTIYAVSAERIPKPATFTAALLCIIAGVAGWFRYVAALIKAMLTVIPSLVLSLISGFRGYEAIISIFVGIPLTILFLYGASILLEKLLENLKQYIRHRNNYIPNKT